jgi:lipopolysaccharide transport protein LptA
VLKLEKNVKAVVEGDTVITTPKAYYDFKEEKGWGKQPVFAEGSWGNMRAEAFSYDKVAQILVLKGNNRITTDKGVLTAKKETRVYREENKSVAVGDAVITQNDSKLYAEEIVGWFGSSSKKELERAEAYRRVRLETPKEIITGNEAYYDALQGKIDVYGHTRNQCNKESLVKVQQGENNLNACHVTAYVSGTEHKELQKVTSEVNVTVQTAAEKMSGEKGIYEPNIGKITVFGGRQPVVINKEDKVLRAQKVVAHLDKDRKLKYAEAFGDVEVVTPKGSAWGDRGVYNPVEQKVELFENVRLEQNGNFITGAYAVTDLATSISRIKGDESTNGRIRGTFYKKRK